MSCYLCDENAPIDSDPCDDCEREFWTNPVLVVLDEADQ